MKEIPLLRGGFCLVDNDDYDELSKYTWYSDISGYVVRAAEKKAIRMHREIMNTPSGLVVDHIDKNTKNNQRSNLRNCTHSQNNQNRSVEKRNLSGYKGVSLYFTKFGEKRYRTRIYVSGRNISVGSHQTAQEAAVAYNRAAIEYFGDFADLNKGV